MTRPAPLILALLAAVPAQAERLTTPYHLAQIEALPRLQNHSPAATQINAALAARDLADLEFAVSCIVPVDLGGSLVTDQTGSFDRFVQVGMAGPHYLSILVTIEASCVGAAHGFTDLQPLTFDLTTGTPLDWPSVLPPAWAEGIQSVGGLDRATQRWKSPAMTAHYHAHSPRLDDPNCNSVVLVQDPYFSFLLDARNHRLVMFPSESSHATLACDDPVWLTPTDLAGLGADARLIAALGTS